MNGEDKMTMFLVWLSVNGDLFWFLVHAPIAPHSTVNLVPEFSMDEPMYAERHVHLFKDYIIPGDEKFNPEVQGGVSWVRELPRSPK